LYKTLEITNVLCFLSSLPLLPPAAKAVFGSDPQSRLCAKLFLQSSELGLPQPLSHRRVSPPPSLCPGGAVHSLAREGVGVSQFQRGDIHCGTLYTVYMCFVVRPVISLLLANTALSVCACPSIRLESFRGIPKRRRVWVC
jgi:hypothetical protein